MPARCDVIIMRQIGGRASKKATFGLFEGFWRNVEKKGKKWKKVGKKWKNEKKCRKNSKNSLFCSKIEWEDIWVSGHGAFWYMVKKSRALPVTQQTSILIGCHHWKPLFSAGEGILLSSSLLFYLRKKKFICKNNMV